MTERHILIVDDDAQLAEALVERFQAYEEFAIVTAGPKAQARNSGAEA